MYIDYYRVNLNMKSTTKGVSFLTKELIPLNKQNILVCFLDLNFQVSKLFCTFLNLSRFH